MKHTPQSTTHWACQNRLDKEGGQAKCCDCHKHEGCGEEALKDNNNLK